MFAVIDVGSNSVRLMLNDGIKTLSKEVNTTQLAEGLYKSSTLTFEAVERTARAVSFFIEKAKSKNISNIYVFATAAVRQAKNGADFCLRVKELSGYTVDVIDGETEAKLGAIGALNGQNGGVIDIGGASTEIIVLDGDKVNFVKSFDVGAVRVRDICGEDQIKTDNYVFDQIKYYDLRKTKFFGIGGTITSVSALIQQLDVYDADKTNGFIITINDVLNLKNKLFNMSIDERKNLSILNPKRAEIIAHGVSILYAIMKKYNINEIITSESDNLEGYLLYKRGLI